MPVESTRCAAAAVPVHPNVLTWNAGAPCLVFELHDHFWNCECCGGIYDMALTLRVNGVEVRSWYEDGHFGETRIDWQEAIALAMGHARARLTTHPLPDEDGGPYTLIVDPIEPDSAPPLPDPIHALVWTTVSEATPEGGCYTRVHVHLNGQPVTVWREEEHWDEPLHDQGPVVESLRALGATVNVVTIDPPTDDDDLPEEDGTTSPDDPDHTAAGSVAAR